MLIEADEAFVVVPQKEGIACQTQLRQASNKHSLLCGVVDYDGMVVYSKEVFALSVYGIRSLELRSDNIRRRICPEYVT